MTSKSEFNAIFAIPERCFECTLTEIQPSSIKSLKGKWIPEAVELFNHYTEHQIAIIDVYSVVNDVASVRLIVENIKVNLKLIKKGYAQFCDENYMSKMNYDTREQKQRIGRIDYGPEVEFAEKIDNSKTVNIKSPPMHLCYKKVYLKGPFTPLETSLHGFTHSASTKQIVVDSTSVNSVVLDVDPQVRNVTINLKIMLIFFWT